MIYHEYPPAPSLAGAVASYWRFALPCSHQPVHFIHTVPPDGVANLCWLPSGRAVVVGPRISALRVPVQAGGEYLGVRFLPGAAGPLLGLDIRTIRDAVLPVDRPDFTAVMQNSGLAGMDALLLDWCERAAWQCPDPVVVALTQRILQSDGTAPVSALTAGLNISYRQILRRFHQAAGLTPKEFARVRRLRATCLEAIRLVEPDWAGLSAGAGFYDQSHLAREFRDMYGWPPRLVHEYLRRIDHSHVAD